ncbi:unnamed protein product [Malus baccata var. baccata]
MLRLQLEENKGILGQFSKVKKIERAFELKRKELQHGRSKLKKMCHENSKEMANCLQFAANQMQACHRFCIVRLGID